MDDTFDLFQAVTVPGVGVSVDVRAVSSLLAVLWSQVYSVMQLDRNSSEMDPFHKPTSYKPYVKTSITFARHEYGRV